MVKIFTLLVAMVAATAINSFGQSGFRTYVPNTNLANDWNCSDSAQPEHCTRVLSKHDTAWNFAGTLFNNSELWRRFQEDNPDKTSVTTNEKGEPILIWKEGITVRIRKSDLDAMQSGLIPADQPANPVPVTVQIVTDSSWFSLPWVLLWAIPLAAFALWLIFQGLAALGNLGRSRRRSQGRPAEFGPGFRPETIGYLLNQPPTQVQVMDLYTRLMPNGFDFIYEVIVERGKFLTQYADGEDRLATAKHDRIYFGGKIAADGNIEEVVPAWQMCFNPLARLDREAAEVLLASSPSFGESILRHTRMGMTAPPWGAVETFWRNQVQASMQRTVEAPKAAPVIEDAPVTPIELTPEGLKLRGTIKLPGGATLDPGNNVVTQGDLSTLEFGSVSLHIGEKPRSFDSKGDVARSNQVVDDHTDDAAAS